MAERKDREFLLTFAAWKASQAFPCSRGDLNDWNSFRAFIRAFEAEIRLSGYRIVRDTDR